MNRQQLAYFRVVALTMAGIIATLTLCNLFTIATKSISVEIPSEDDIHWSIDPVQKEILFRTTFSVKNHGVYDINDIDISARLMKDGTKSLLTFEKQDMVVQRGSDTTFDLLIPIDLFKIPWFDWLSLMYKNSTLTLQLDVDATYMFGLIDFTANEAIKIPWSPPPLLNFSNNTVVQEGVTGILTLLNIAQNGSTPSLSDLISLVSLPQIYYSAENGFAFSLNISSYSETVENITCHLIIPFLVMDGGVEFTVSILVGFDAGAPVLKIQEVRVQYVT
jgi:hypothetical protein